MQQPDLTCNCLLHPSQHLDPVPVLAQLPASPTPSLGDDVVVRGTEIPIEDPNAFRVQPDVLVDLNLGDNFEVRGQGLEARLEGQLSLRATPALHLCTQAWPPLPLPPPRPPSWLEAHALRLYAAGAAWRRA